jgi:hypothetical protein
MGCILGNPHNYCWGDYMDSNSGLEIASHILNFGIWIYLMIIAYNINYVTFNSIILPLLGLVGSLILSLIKIGRKN